MHYPQVRSREVDRNLYVTFIVHYNPYISRVSLFFTRLPSLSSLPLPVMHYSQVQERHLQDRYLQATFRVHCYPYIFRTSLSFTLFSFSLAVILHPRLQERLIGVDVTLSIHYILNVCLSSSLLLPFLVLSLTVISHPHVQKRLMKFYMGLFLAPSFCTILCPRFCISIFSPPSPCALSLSLLL